MIEGACFSLERKERSSLKRETYQWQQAIT